MIYHNLPNIKKILKTKLSERWETSIVRTLDIKTNSNIICRYLKLKKPQYIWQLQKKVWQGGDRPEQLLCPHILDKYYEINEMWVPRATIKKYSAGKCNYGLTREIKRNFWVFSLKSTG